MFFINLNENIDPLTNALKIFDSPHTVSTNQFHYIIPSQLYDSHLQLQHVQPSSLFYVFDHYIKNINKKIYPNLPPLIMSQHDLTNELNKIQLKIIITKLAKKFPFFRAFFPYPSSQLQINQLQAALALINVSNTRLRNHLSNSILNINRPTIILNPFICKNLPKSDYFAYFIYTLRDTTKNYILLDDLLNQLSSSPDQRKYMKKKILKTVNSQKTLFRTVHTIKNQTYIYFNGINKLLHHYDLLYTSGNTYFQTTSFTQFRSLITQTIATASFITTHKKSTHEHSSLPLHGRSISEIMKQTGFSNKTVTEQLKPVQRIHRWEVLASFPFYEDAWEKMIELSLSLNTNPLHHKHVYIHKVFNNENLLDTYEVRQTLSNFYVSNALIKKRFIRDFHKLFAVTENGKVAFKSPNDKKQFQKALSQFKVFKFNAEKFCDDITSKSMFPFNNTQEMKYQKKHNPNKFDPTSYTPDMFIKTNHKFNQCLEVEVTIPYMHPDLINGTNARENFILFVTNPFYKADFLNMIENKKIKNSKPQHELHEHEHVYNKKEDLTFLEREPKKFKLVKIPPKNLQHEQVHKEDLTFLERGREVKNLNNKNNLKIKKLGSCEEEN